MPEQTKDERAVWLVFMNLPGDEALKLFEEARKILVSRNLIKATRTRKKKGNYIHDYPGA